jgi:hypothetical protein
MTISEDNASSNGAGGAGSGSNCSSNIVQSSAANNNDTSLHKSISSDEVLYPPLGQTSDQAHNDEQVTRFPDYEDQTKNPATNIVSLFRAHDSQISLLISSLAYRSSFSMNRKC